jgi:hypothetical protein
MQFKLKEMWQYVHWLCPAVFGKTERLFALPEELFSSEISLYRTPKIVTREELKCYLFNGEVVKRINKITGRVFRWNLKECCKIIEEECGKMVLLCDVWCCSTEHVFELFYRNERSWIWLFGREEHITKIKIIITKSEMVFWSWNVTSGSFPSVRLISWRYTHLHNNHFSINPSFMKNTKM